MRHVIAEREQKMIVAIVPRRRKALLFLRPNGENAASISGGITSEEALSAAMSISCDGFSPGVSWITLK